MSKKVWRVSWRFRAEKGRLWWMPADNNQRKMAIKGVPQKRLGWLKNGILSPKTQTEERGFEPLVPFGTTVFKTATISHSVTPPSLYITRSYMFSIVPDFQLIPTHFIRFWRVLQEDLRAIIRVNFRPNAQVFCKKLKVFANF